MNFFKNKIVKLVAWVLLILSAVVLTIGGVKQAEFTSVITAVIGIVTAVSALVILIGNLINKKEDVKKF
jgi:succinate-acetate transporter protein